MNWLLWELAGAYTVHKELATPRTYAEVFHPTKGDSIYKELYLTDYMSFSYGFIGCGYGLSHIHGFEE